MTEADKIPGDIIGGGSSFAAVYGDDVVNFKPFSVPRGVVSIRYYYVVATISTGVIIMF